MIEISINYWAVLVAAVASMVIGYVWYMPALFGKSWMKLSGVSQEMADKGAGSAMFGAFIASLVTAYVLAMFIDYTGATTFTEGLKTGLWLWLGFIAAVNVHNIVFEQKPMGLYWINQGYQLVNFLVAATILTLWV
jgi:uncharacterized membrane protein